LAANKDITRMSAAHVSRTLASRVLPFLLLCTCVIRTNLPAALAATKPTTPSPSTKLQSSQPTAKAAATFLASPAATGPLRILLVDDDYSDNNNIPGDSRRSFSDTVFSKLVSDAVGGDKASWSLETVKSNANGPLIDRLRPFSLILWYTGASYGGNPDNTSVLSIEDEKTVRRYLEEVGGTVVLISPGYVSKVLEQGSSWESTSWPFLKEVMGVRGGRGLAQRFVPGLVTTPQGAQFQVGKGSVVESQFSAVNPDAAEVLFTAELESMKGPVPVATANKYGKGRFIYIGYTFENLDPKALAPAFQQLLAATGLTPTGSPTAACPPSTAPTGNAQNGAPATVQVSGTPTTAVVNWTLPTATLLNASLGLALSTRTAQTAPASQVTAVTVERLMPNAAPVRLNVASPDALKADDAGPLMPGQAVTYRVTLLNGCTALGAKDAVFTPPLPRDPTGLVATPGADSSVTLAWQAVDDASVNGYQVTGTSLTAPVVVRYATQWTSPTQAPGTQQWKVATIYAPGSVLTAASAWPSVMSHIVPTPHLQYLSLPNGTGSYAESQAHYATRCDQGAMAEFGATWVDECLSAAHILASATNWTDALVASGNGLPDGAEWSTAAFADLHDLGLGRRANCVPRKGKVTLCWATSHGSIPAAGASVDGSSLAGLGERLSITKSLNFIIVSGSRAFFGTWEGPVTPDVASQGGYGGVIEKETDFADSAAVVYGTQLDSQGRKSVPHACLSCHGGHFDTTSKLVIGASLLPLIPADLTFSSPQARANSEEPIRRINQIILDTNPAPTIKTQITTLYNGSPGTPNTPANDAAVPAGWASQPGLYKQVIAPYCGSCHFAQTGPLNFGTFKNVMDNKQRIQRAVCVDFSMPHSEQGLRKFWSEGGTVSLPGMLSTALGFPKCPQ
jgi:hypothetical protein